MATNSNSSVESLDYQKLLNGRWVGYLNTDPNTAAMFVSFEPRNIVVIDYSPKGGSQKRLRYELNKKELKIEGYKDVFLIERKGDDVIHFYVRSPELREDVDMIYACDFKKLPST